MCLAVSNLRLLTLTARKSDCEYNISINSMEKMALTRQQSDLSREYSARLNAKSIAYYANGQYNQMDYQYLMGRGVYTATQIVAGNTDMMKEDCSMILTDNNGYVVMSDSYASILKQVLGDGCIDSSGRGRTFSADKIPEIIAKIAGAYCSEDDVKNVLNNGEVQSGFNAKTQKTKSGDVVSTGDTVDTSGNTTAKIQAIVNYFYPIFQAAAANGWTTEYNQDMTNNSNYVSDALVTGSFQLEQVDDGGAYKPDASLTYFTTAGLVIERTDSSVREQVTAWYNAEKAAISEKEEWLDLEISDLSTELEAINTEIESVKSMVQDGTEAFSWGTQG